MNSKLRKKPARYLVALFGSLLLLQPALLTAQAVKQDSVDASATPDKRIPIETKPMTAPTIDEDVIMMSPFQVDATKEKGYFAENTLAGSRMKTNVGDLAASISIVTKQQMEDTASLDINDVFRYEVNTEGSNTYTPQIIDRNTVKDAVAGYTGGDANTMTNATSNRVRGLAAPGGSLNYYAINNNIPFDSYNTGSVEISRGPNSLLFGMGSPAGIVNQSTSQALINKDVATVSFRVDDRGSNRMSFSFNKSLLRDTLAIYGAFLYNDQQFERKPSYDVTRRQYGAVTYKPFRKTVIRGMVEGYSNDNRRPNSVTPRDFVSTWNQAGRPVYDPIARTITLLDTGVVKGPYLLSTSSPYYTAGLPVGASALTTNTSSLYLPGITWSDVSRPVIRVDNGDLINFMQKQPVKVIPYFPAGGVSNPSSLPSDATIYANAASAAIYERQWTQSTALQSPTWNGNTISSYNWAGVTDKAIYDWSRINTTQANYGSARNAYYNVEVEQEILPNLFASAGWLRQDFDLVSNYTISQQTGATLFVDTNLNLPDGSPNPYVGLPYIEDFQPDTITNSEMSDNYRAMIAFTPDFTKNNNWTRWLGKHQLMGMWAYQNTDRQNFRKRLVYTDADEKGALRYLTNRNPNASGDPTGYNLQGAGIRRNYYLASPGDPMGKVTHSTGTWGQPGYGGKMTDGQVRVYDWDTGQWTYVDVTLGMVDHDASTGRNQRQLNSWNFGWQASLWNDRIIPTLGWRRDEYRARTVTNAAYVDADGNSIAAMTNQQKWVNGVYQWETVFNRWKPWEELTGNTSTKGVVVRPFKGWDFVERPAGNGSIWAEFLSSLGLTYNQSDNFNPPSSASTDVFKNPLPKPTGEGKDWGFQFSLFKNKLFARVNWYEASNMNDRGVTSAAGLILSRLTSNIDTTLFRSYCETIVRIQDGEDPTSESWAQTSLTDPQKDRVSQLWGLPYDYYTGGYSATQDNEAKGMEIQVTYNPLPNWTMKFTAGKQTTVYNNIAQQYDAWLAFRNPTWQAAKHPELAQYTEWGTSKIPLDLTNFWTSYGYRSEVREDSNGNLTDVNKYFNDVVESQVSLAKALQGAASPNQRKWRASYVTTYQFTRGALKGFAIGGAERWEDKAVMGYYGRAADSTLPTTINASDITRPIYTPENWYTDLWVSYTRKIMNEKVRMKLQLNVSNVFEGGGLQAIAVNWDGSEYGYRIVDPRQFVLSASFEF